MRMKRQKEAITNGIVEKLLNFRSLFTGNREEKIIGMFVRCSPQDIPFRTEEYPFHFETSSVFGHRTVVLDSATSF